MDTSKILISGDDAYILIDDFSNFTAELTSFALGCYPRQGKTKRYYSEAFSRVNESFAEMLAGRNISNWVTQPVNSLLEDVRQIINSKKINDVELEKIHHRIREFLENEIFSDASGTFKHKFLENAISDCAKAHYSDGLFDAVSDSLAIEDYDAAVLAAFKYLDERLRRLAGVDSYQYFGEELINKVFSPQSGVLQIKTHPNEQIGLRNWFSGANAVFRNPIAHRFGNMDERSALSTIAMVGLMVKLATELSGKHNKTESG